MQRKILIGLILTLIIAIFIPVYWAMEAGRQEAALARQKAEAVDRGAKQYALSCAVCHGAEGEGRVGPALRGSVLSEDALLKITTRGVPRTAMVAWGQEEGGPLKEHQIKDLATFIKNWEGTLPPAPASSPSPTVPSATETTAIDASKIFADKCSVCHGKNRQGVSGLGPALTTQSLAPRSDTEIGDTIRNGRSGTAMPPFKATLSPEVVAALLQFIKYTSP